MRKTVLFPGLLLIACGKFASAQSPTPFAQPPIIDVHVHAMSAVPGGFPASCPFPPGFSASDPKNGPESQVGWTPQQCTFPLLPAKDGDDYRKQVLDEMERLNVTAIVMGDQEELKKWTDASPKRVIPGISFWGMGSSGYTPVEKMREYFEKGGFKVMGEIGLQYEGVSPSDPSVDKYFALAEELDIPVGIHMGTGGSGRANIAMTKFRGSMGNPLLLEELLARHPKLRLWIMHAGYPMIDNLLTLLQTNSHVYVDIAGLIWSYPLEEVNRYIERIVKAGFEDRIMYGTDEVLWPNLMETSIRVIQNADYLTPEQKRDILYNNAARFLRLDQTKAK